MFQPHFKATPLPVVMSDVYRNACFLHIFNYYSSQTCAYVVRLPARFNDSILNKNGFYSWQESEQFADDAALNWDIRRPIEQSLLNFNSVLLQLFFCY